MNSWAQPFGDKRLGPFYMWPVAYSITKIFYLPIRVVYNTKKTNYDTYRQTGTEMGERMNEYYGAAEPPVRCGESHLSGLTEPPQFVY